ncbi:uncharacterized protein LOC110113026 isoform X1 [Dendrobium catenatum]|uniref:uncharacterized protein LOC110113026 isoform X1 n=1 Tax=Dendrobium catenatum TaxID=906689 RepID=UPI0010A089E7|nr:uncharacterized protein LOC110113026 isoform X1 [Dendrobium catenatum]
MNSLGLPLPKPHLSHQTLISNSKTLIPFQQWRLRSQSSKGFPFLRRKRTRIHATTALLQRSEHDVVVVGAGIIGLSIARQLLLESDLSVAIVDAGLPCSGATGAGQGYVWMAHKTPGSDIWELAMRSKYLWEELAESLQRRGYDPLQVLGWKKTGSLLIGRTSEELAILEERVRLLSYTGLRVEFLSSNSLLSREPSLEVGKEGGAAFFPDDCQIDAFNTASFIEKGNNCFASKGRYAEFYNDPAKCLVRSERNGEAEAIQTSKNILYFKKALVLAAGAWSECLMRSLFVETDIVPVPVKPRKGHLIVLENFNGIQLNHGLMEVGYMDHQFASYQPVDNKQHFSSVSMTATTDMNGNLVLGSSRQFSGFCKQVEEPIVKSILERAAEFFPTLNNLFLKLNENGKIRVGFRPYMPDGKPVIGPILRFPKVFLATGHEGSGLSLALGTAEMVADMILGNPSRVDCKPFSVEGRFSH